MYVSKCKCDIDFVSLCERKLWIRKRTCDFENTHLYYKNQIYILKNKCDDYIWILKNIEMGVFSTYKYGQK